MIEQLSSLARLSAAGGVHTFDVVTGTEDADTLLGTEGADIISGLGGNDFISSGHGADSIDGGEGADRIFTADQGDTVHGGGGNDFIQVAAVHTDSGATGTYAGDAGDDQVQVGGVDPDQSNGVTLQGGDGDDALGDVSIGSDLLDGGADFDMLIFVRLSRSVTVDLGAGTSEGKQIGSNTLANIEGINSGRADDILTGSSVANLILGRNGADVISGMDGDDTLYGGGRNDTITGGLGADSLDGGGGHDVFIYESIADSSVGHSDFITRLKKHDVIDLSAIDADVHTAGDQAFHRVKAFSGHAGEMVLSYAGGVTTVQLDVDGDGQADMAIQLAQNHLTYHGFVL